MMKKRKLISIVISVAILACVFACIIIKHKFSDSWLYQVIKSIGVWAIYWAIYCAIYVAMGISIIYVIYRVCSAINTRIINKYVKSANKRKLIRIVIAVAILACVFAYIFISDSDKSIKCWSLMLIYSAIISTILCVIMYLIFKIYSAINTRIINKHVKSENIRESISMIGIMVPIIIALGFPLYGIFKNNVNSVGTGGTLNRDRYVANTIYGAIGVGDMIENSKNDYEKTENDIYVAKIKSRIDPNAVLSVKFSRKAIPWPYTAEMYLVRHVIGSMMVRLKYPILVLPKDLNSGIYPWNLEDGASGTFNIFSIGFTENDIIQATRINQLPLNESEAFLIAEKNNIRVYKERLDDEQSYYKTRYIILTGFPNQKHPLIMKYNYHKENRNPKLWGYGSVGGHSEFTITTSLSPNFIVEYEIYANRTAKHVEEDKKRKQDFDHGIMWTQPTSFGILHGGTKAVTDLYNLIINTRDVIEIKDRLIDDPEYPKLVKEDPDWWVLKKDLYYTEISKDRPELLVDHPEIFAKIIEYNEKFVSYIKTIAIETNDGKKFKDAVTIYRVVGDELKQMQFDLKKEVEITNKENKEGNK